MTPAFDVLFLCTHNFARSIMAEAILEQLGRDRFQVYSAGSDPFLAPRPEVMAKLRTFGHDVSLLRSKSWDEFMGPEAPRMDFIIALCDPLHGRPARTSATRPSPCSDRCPTLRTSPAARHCRGSCSIRYTPASSAGSVSLSRCHSSRSTAWRCAPASTSVATRYGPSQDARLHQRHGPHRPAALRAAMGGMDRPDDDPRGRNRLDIVHVNELKAALQPQRTCSSSRSYVAVGALGLRRMMRRSRSTAIASVSRQRRSSPTFPGATSGATWCWSAPASSSNPISSPATSTVV